MTKIANLPMLTDDERDDACFRARDRAWAALAGLFDELAEAEDLTYKELGDRVGKSRSQVQRWLSAPHNMTMQSCGLLAEGLDADLVIEVRRRLKETISNACHPQVSAAADASYRAFTLMPSANTTAPDKRIDRVVWLEKLSG